MIKEETKKSNKLVELWNDKERRGKMIRSVVPFVGLVFIVLFFQIATNGKMLTPVNLKTVLNQAFSILICATGMAFVLAQGNLDFSMGSIAGMSGVFAAMVAVRTGNLLLTVLTGLVSGMLIGCLNGLLFVGMRAPSNIVTLCTQFTFRGVVQVVAASGGLVAPLAWGWVDGVPVKLTVAILLVAVSYIAFEYTKFGKYCKAIGSGGAASIQSGVPLEKMQILAFVVSGAAAGLAGFFSLIRASSVNTQTGNGVEMNALLAIVLGGMPLSGGANSKIRAVVLGSAMLAFLMNGLVVLGLPDSAQQGVKGLVFLIAVAISFERANIAVIK